MWARREEKCEIEDKCEEEEEEDEGEENSDRRLTLAPAMLAMRAFGWDLRRNCGLRACMHACVRAFHESRRSDCMQSQGNGKHCMCPPWGL